MDEGGRRATVVPRVPTGAHEVSCIVIIQSIKRKQKADIRWMKAAVGPPWGHRGATVVPRIPTRYMIKVGEYKLHYWRLVHGPPWLHRSYGAHEVK